MRWWRTYAVGLVFGLVLGAVFVAGYALGQRHPAADASADFTTLWRVRDLLERKYVDPAPPAQKQVFGAIHGLVASFGDRFTHFSEPANSEVAQDDLRGHFGGIGASLSRDEAANLVLTVMRDRPAAKAGVKDGDILLAVDALEVTPTMPIDEIVAAIRGQEGSAVALRLRRAGAETPITVRVVRERIETPSVEWRVLDSAASVGYLRISIFGQQTVAEAAAGLAELAEAGTTKLVLDLRGNSGGLVDAAVDVASLFLTEGVVLREVRRGGVERFYPVEATRSPARTWTIALLVDAGTASASEIVAGALADHGRATLIGAKTYGKGSMQEVHTLPDGSSLHVTIARWLTPGRRQIDGEGITPDHLVGRTEEERQAGLDPQLAWALAWLKGER